MPPVKLAQYATDDLLAEARRVAQGRLGLARQRNRTQPFGDPGNENRGAVDGWSSLAEALVASWLGAPWVNDLIEDLSVKPPDVGVRTEVRWTKHHPGHLIIHDSDPDDRIAILVRKELPDIEVVGWTIVSTAKRKRYRNHPKARSPQDYWYPANELLMCDLLYQIRHSV